MQRLKQMFEKKDDGNEIKDKKRDSTAETLLNDEPTSESLEEHAARIRAMKKRVKQEKDLLAIQAEKLRLSQMDNKNNEATEEKTEEVDDNNEEQQAHHQENQENGQPTIIARSTAPPRPTTSAPPVPKRQQPVFHQAEEALPHVTFPPLPPRDDEQGTEREGEHLDGNVARVPDVETTTTIEEDIEGQYWHPAGPSETAGRVRVEGYEGFVAKKDVRDFSQAKHQGSTVRGSSELHNLGGGGGYGQLDVEEGGEDTHPLLYHTRDSGYDEDMPTEEKPTRITRSLNALYKTLRAVGYTGAYTMELAIINGLPVFLSETVGPLLLPEGLAPEVIAGLMTVNGAVNNVLGGGLNAAITPVVTHKKLQDYGRVKKQRVSGASSSSFMPVIGHEIKEQKSAWRGAGKVIISEAFAVAIPFGVGAGVMGVARFIDWLASTQLQSNVLDTSKSRLPIIATTGALAMGGYVISERVYVIGMNAWSLRMHPSSKDAYESHSQEGKVKKFCREFTQDTAYGVLHVLTVTGAVGTIILVMQADGKHFDNAAIENMARMVNYQFYATLAAETSLNLARFFINGCELNLGESRRPPIHVDLAGHEDDEGYKSLAIHEQKMSWKPTWKDMAIDGVWRGVGAVVHATLCTAAGYTVTYFCLDGNNNNELDIVKNGSIMDTTMVATHIALNRLVYPVAQKLANSCWGFFSTQTCNPTSRGYQQLRGGGAPHPIDLGNETPTDSPRALSETAEEIRKSGDLSFDEDATCLPSLNCCRK